MTEENEVGEKLFVPNDESKGVVGDAYQKMSDLYENRYIWSETYRMFTDSLAHTRDRVNLREHWEQCKRAVEFGMGEQPK